MALVGTELELNPSRAESLDDLSAQIGSYMEKLEKDLFLHHLVWPNWNIKIDRVDFCLNPMIFAFSKELKEGLTTSTGWGEAKAIWMRKLATETQGNRMRFDEYVKQGGILVDKVGSWHYEKAGEKYRFASGMHVGSRVAAEPTVYFLTAHYPDYTYLIRISNADRQALAPWEKVRC